MFGKSNLCLWIYCLYFISHKEGAKIDDENRPYEFGFTIDGQQHRHERRDANGIIQGEFGFITADGVYHVTAYATDENGRFKILSMRNIKLSGPLDGSQAGSYTSKPLPIGESFSSTTSPPSPSFSQPVGTSISLPRPSTVSNVQITSTPVIPISATIGEVQNIQVGNLGEITQRPQNVNSGKINTTKRPIMFTTQPTIKPACAGCGYVTRPSSTTPRADSTLNYNEINVQTKPSVNIGGTNQFGQGYQGIAPGTSVQGQAISGQGIPGQGGSGQGGSGQGGSGQGLSSFGGSSQAYGTSSQAQGVLNQDKINQGILGHAISTSPGVSGQGVLIQTHDQGISVTGVSSQGIPSPEVSGQDVLNQGVMSQGGQNQGISNTGVSSQGISDTGVSSQGLGIPSQGVLNQGILSQAGQNEGIPTTGVAGQGQGIPSPGASSQGVLNQGISSQGGQNQRIPTTGVSIQGHGIPSPGASSQGVLNQGISKPGISSQGQGIPSPGASGQGVLNQGISGQAGQNQGISKPGVSSQGQAIPSPGASSQGVLDQGILSKGGQNQGISKPGILSQGQGIPSPGASIQGVLDQGISNQGGQNQGISTTGVLIQGQGIPSPGASSQGVLDQGISSQGGQIQGIPTTGVSSQGQGIPSPGASSQGILSQGGQNQGIPTTGVSGQGNVQNHGVQTSSKPHSIVDDIKVENNTIYVPNNPPIPIKDKYPGMQDGLPQGITAGDISDILYKFNYTIGFHGHYEMGWKNGTKIGGYFVNGRDGISRVVTYVADELGYRPRVKLINLGLDSPLTPKEDTEKSFGLQSFEFVWYPLK